MSVAEVQTDERPALAPDVELVGEFQGTGFAEPQWLVRRGDRFVQLTELLYRIAEQADGRRTVEEIVTVLRGRYASVDDDEVRAFVDRLTARRWLETGDPEAGRGQVRRGQRRG